MSTIKSINPFTEELNAEVEVLTKTEIDEKISLAHNSYLKWKETPKSEKKKLFLALADEIEKNKEDLAKVEMIEMWMLYSFSLAWLWKTANLVRWFANNFEEILTDENYESEWLQVKAQYDSIWVIFWVAPWNFPFNQVLRAAVPNILAWNTTVYKHASNTPLAGQKIEELFLKAGFPEWIYVNLQASSRDSEYIISKEEIAWINLTWSEWAWKAVWWLAWKYIKPSVLELWGNDAFIVWENSDLKKIALEAVKARISNNWQRCNASKRFIVREKDYDEFCKYFTEHTENLVIWDPALAETEIWPMARADLVEEIDEQVQKTIWEWAKLLTGWHKIDRKWYFYAPTVLAWVTPEMTSYKEEIFWPVASIIKVKDIDEAIKIANNSDFWLCWCVYSDNKKEAIEIASKVETWMMFVNMPAGSRASLSFGWVKKSGYGKENWPEWLKAFTNRKVIVY